MNKQNVTLTEFKILLKEKSIVTVEDVYYHLRDTYPGIDFDRATIGTYIRRGFERNLLEDVATRSGRHGAKEYSIDKPVVSRVYSVKTNGGPVHGDFQAIAKLVYDLKLPVRYSESTDTFQDFTQLAFPHLENVICKDMENLTRGEIKSYLNSPIFKEYVRVKE